MFKRLPYLILLLCLTTSFASAGELSILINGKAIHFDKVEGESLNEENWGVGIQYDYDRKGRKWAPFLTASGFIDSVDNYSYYAGGGYMRRWNLNKSWHGDAGLVGFIMTRPNYKNGKPFLGVLPAFSLGTDRVALNMTYIPATMPKMVALVFFQLKIKMGK